MDQNEEFLKELSEEEEGHHWDSGIEMEEVSKLGRDEIGEPPMVQHQSPMV